MMHQQPSCNFQIAMCITCSVIRFISGSVPQTSLWLAESEMEGLGFHCYMLVIVGLIHDCNFLVTWNVLYFIAETLGQSETFLVYYSRGWRLCSSPLSIVIRDCFLRVA